MSDKRLRFEFVLDQSSFSQVMSALDKMIAKSQVLAKTLQGINLGGGSGGILSGGGVGGGFGSPSQSIANNAGKGMGNSVSRVVMDNANVFKNMANLGTASLKGLTDALKTSVDQQRATISNLKASLDALGTTYDRLGGKGRTAVAVQGKMLQVAGRITNGQAGLSSSEEMLRNMSSKTVLMSPPAAGGGGFRNWLNSGGSPDVNGRSLGQAAGMMGFGGVGSLISLGPWAAAATVGAGLGANEFRSWNNSPMYKGQKVAENASLMSSYYSKLRGGNYSDQRALDSIMSDTDKRADYNEAQGIRGPVTDWNSFKRAGSTMVRDELDRYKSVANAFLGGGVGEAAGEYESNFYTKHGGQYYNQKKKELQRESLDTETAGQGRVGEIYDEATQNANSKMSLMRALGMGAGHTDTGYKDFAQRMLLNFNQFDPSEVVGAVQGLTRNGTRGMALGKNGMLNSVLQAQAAGITGAADIGGIMGRLGQTGYVDTLRGLAGAGVDVSTTNFIGNAVSQMGDNYNAPGFTGLGMTATLAYGAEGQGGAMVARQNMAGQSAFQALLSGSRDPAQKALNLIKAVGVAPNAKFYAQRYLATGLDAGRVEDILGGNTTLTPQETAMGITAPMLEQMAEQIKGTRHLRVRSEGFGEGTDARKMAELLEGGNSAKGAAGKLFGGKNGILDTEKERQQAIDTYSALLGADGNMDLKTAIGAARDDLFGHGSVLKQGKKVGDVAGGSTEAGQSAVDAANKKVDLTVRETGTDTIEKNIAKGAESYRRMLGTANNMATSSETIATILGNHAGELRKVIKALGGGSSSNTKTGPAK